MVSPVIAHIYSLISQKFDTKLSFNGLQLYSNQRHFAQYFCFVDLEYRIILRNNNVREPTSFITLEWYEQRSLPVNHPPVISPSPQLIRANGSNVDEKDLGTMSSAAVFLTIVLVPKQSPLIMAKIHSMEKSVATSFKRRGTALTILNPKK